MVQILKPQWVPILLILVSLCATTVVCDEGDDIADEPASDEEDECATSLHREEMRKEWFSDQYDDMFWIIIAAYIGLVLLAFADLGMMIRENRTNAEASRATENELPVMPGLRERAQIYLRRGREQMFGVHSTALHICLAILYSTAIENIFEAIYQAVNEEGAVSEECSENLCNYGEESEGKWGVLIPAYIFAVLVALLTFKIMITYIRYQGETEQSTTKQREYWITFAGGFVGHIIGFRWKAIIKLLYEGYSYPHTTFLDFYHFKGYFIHSWVPERGRATESTCDSTFSKAACDSSSEMAITGRAQPATSWGWADGSMHANTFPAMRPDNFAVNETCFFVRGENQTDSDFWGTFSNQFWCSPEEVSPGALHPALQKADNTIRGWWFQDDVYFIGLWTRVWKMVVLSLFTIAVLIALRYLLELRRKALEALLDAPDECGEPNQKTTESDGVTIHTNELHTGEAGENSPAKTSLKAKVRSFPLDTKHKAVENLRRNHERGDTDVLDEAVKDVLNDAAGLSIGWLIARVAYWLLYGVITSVERQGSWRGIGVPSSLFTKFALLFVSLSFMRSFCVWIEHWIKVRNDFEHHAEASKMSGAWTQKHRKAKKEYKPLWLSKYWSGLEDVVTKWTIGYFVFFFLQQEEFFFQAQRDNYSKGSAAACIWGTTTFTADTYPEAETFYELGTMIMHPFVSVLILTLYRLAIDGEAIEAAQYSTWMAKVDKVVKCADSNTKAKAGLRPQDREHLHVFVKHQAKRGKQVDREMMFVIAYSAIQAALAFETFLDMLVEVTVGCGQHLFWSSEEACLAVTKAELNITQAALFLVFALVLTMLFILTHKYLIVPYHLLQEDEQLEEEEPQPKLEGELKDKDAGPEKQEVELQLDLEHEDAVPAAV